MSHHRLSRSSGFTLIELVVVVAIIAILGTVAVSAFLTYRDKSRVSATVASSDAIRSALAGYATAHATMSYPAAIADYNSLVTLVNAHGGQLSPTSYKSGFTLQDYTAIDSEKDGDYESYTLRVRVSNVPTTKVGWCVVITPSAITRCDAI
jgi:prepilin-type N-terminal cleavage/methylation domain-containing protein